MTTTASETMTIANQLVALCREGRNLDAIRQFYAPDVRSVEAVPGPAWEQTTSGLEGVIAKNEWWAEHNEVHSATIEGPFPHEDRFILFMAYDVTMKAGPMAGQRIQMKETGLYTVSDGKIVTEEFFYDAGCEG